MINVNLRALKHMVSIIDFIFFPYQCIKKIAIKLNSKKKRSFMFNMLKNVYTYTREISMPKIEKKKNRKNFFFFHWVNSIKNEIFFRIYVSNIMVVYNGVK